ncbi:LysR family transcriptional regulator [Streptomyces sp. NPDC048825]|uniref:LysR family transcriptional regulator n=1 Tax=Streptomyces sp. NPDC048825 TaxID=3365592 RepID=UPI0037146314
MPTTNAPLDLNRVDLNLLVAFDALMAERSVTAAAARLSVGQPAMSSTLARLRKLLNDPILVRQGRTMVATPVAESLVQPVHKTLTDIKSLLSQRDSFDPATNHRTYSVMATSYSAVAVLHPLLAQLPAEAPNVRLRIQPFAEEYAEQLARDQIDLVIVPREMVPSGLDVCSEAAYTDCYMLAVDQEHPDVGESISVEEFSELPYLAISPDRRPALAELQLDMLGIPRRVEVTTSFEIAPFLIRGTRLITLIPRTFGRRIAPATGLRLLEPPMELPWATEMMVWTKRMDDDPGHAWLRQRMHHFADAYIQGTPPAPAAG